MKKNLIISVLILALLSAMAFGFYERNRAEENEILAVGYEKIALEMTSRAEAAVADARRQTALAASNAMEAQKQLIIAQEFSKSKK